MIIATLVSLCVIAILLILHFRTRGGRDTRQEAPDPSNQNKFDTTLGEFHDMREACSLLAESGVGASSAHCIRSSARASTEEAW